MCSANGNWEFVSNRRNFQPSLEATTARRGDPRQTLLLAKESLRKDLAVGAAELDRAVATDDQRQHLGAVTERIDPKERD